MPNTTPPNEPRCSFCGKTETQANQLVSGPDGVHICDECIASCNEMMAQNAIEQVREDERLLTPQEIKARLDEYVIGQDEAKKILAVAVHNHYKRVFYADASGAATMWSSKRATSCLSAPPEAARRSSPRRWPRPARAVRHRGRHHADRGRVCGRRRGKHSGPVASECRLRP